MRLFPQFPHLAGRTPAKCSNRSNPAPSGSPVPAFPLTFPLSNKVKKNILIESNSNEEKNRAVKLQPAKLPVQLSGRKTNARARYKNYNLSSTRAVKCLLAQIFCDPKSRLKPCLVLMPASCRASLLLSVKKIRARRRQLPRACQRSARCFFAVAKRRSCPAPA